MTPGAAPAAPLPSIEVNVLTWQEWWRRHEWMYTYVRKDETQTTGEGEGTGGVSPQIQSLIGQLIKFLGDDYYDVRSASCLALGKIGQNTPTVRNELVRALKRDKNDEVQQSAALALGMIRAVEATNDVVSVLVNKRNKSELRCYAAISLGLMSSSANLTVLQNMVNSRDAKDEVKAGALLGIGLLGDERGAYTLLKTVMGNANEELQAFAIASLAKLGKTELKIGYGRRSRVMNVIEIFEKKLAIKTTKTQVRRAIALALGTIGDKDTSIRALENAYRMDRDKGVKGFSLMSLAQIAAELTAEDPKKVEVREFLRRAVMRERENTVKGFAALAVGLSKDKEAGKLLLNVFNRESNAEVRAAAAIGLGILRYKDALSALGSEVEKPKSGGDARGLSCVALGMIGDPAASEYLRSVLKDVNIPYLKWMSAMGLAVLGDTNAIPDITSHLNDKNKITREAAIRSLQYFRNDTTINPLLEQFKKEDNNELRALIVVSLGTIGDASKEMPVLRRVGRNVNWVAAVRMKAIDLITRIF